MKDLKKLVAECEAELGAIGIVCGNVRSWSVNTRAKSRWGQCRMVGKGVFDIEISERLLRDEIEEDAVKTTIIHELLHTVEGCQGHRGKWKMLAELVGRAYPRYHIKRTSSYEEKGILQKNSGQRPGGQVRQGDQVQQEGQMQQGDRARRRNQVPQIRYRITCTGCGLQTYRQRAGRLVKNPEDFRCARCGGKLKVEKRC